MAGNRKAAEDFILSNIEIILPGSKNTSIMKELFAEMSDKEFATYIDDLESGKKFIKVFVPNFAESDISVDRNLALADKLGHKFFQKLWIEGKDDMPSYLTPIEYLVVDLPLRRASQSLTKKVSVPKSNRVIDALTGQATGESRGARISYPELQMCAAMNMEDTMVELMKYRGGDSRGYAAMNAMISKTGIARQDTLQNYASGVESTRTLKTFLTGAHLRSTL